MASINGVVIRPNGQFTRRKSVMETEVPGKHALPQRGTDSDGGDNGGSGGRKRGRGGAVGSRAQTAGTTSPFLGGDRGVTPCTGRVRGTGEIVSVERLHFRPRSSRRSALRARNFCKNALVWRGRNKGRWITTVNSREPILGSSPTVPSVMIKLTYT